MNAYQSKVPSIIFVRTGKHAAKNFCHKMGDGAGAVAQPRGQFLATEPEEPEDAEEPAGGQGDCMLEHLAGDAVTQAGFCRDHRGKLQSVWELCEDVADHEDEGGGEDEADRASRAAAAEPPGDPNVGVSRAAAQAQPERQQAQGQHLPETPLPGVTPWPADRLVSGALQLRASATRRRLSDMKAKCTIQHGVMTFRGAMHPGAEMVVLAEVPVSDIVAMIVPDQARKFSICYPEDIDSSQVWCCARDQERRDKWLDDLHRLGVDLYREDDDGEIHLVRQGVQVQPGRTDLSV